MIDGPARLMVLPDPINNPVPMAPPMAMSWICRLESFVGGVLQVLVTALPLFWIGLPSFPFPLPVFVKLLSSRLALWFYLFDLSVCFMH